MVSCKYFSNCCDRWGRLAPFALILVFLSGCGEAPAIFDAAGQGAKQINSLWWLLFGLGSAVYVVVMGYLLLALYRRRQLTIDPIMAKDTVTEGNPEEDHLGSGNTRVVIWGGIIIPTLILLVVYGFTFRTLWALSANDQEADLTIEVIGHQWWWEVRYADHPIITANEIHIPVGQSVRIQLTSADVIHSFWVPELHGKLDMIPGRVNTIWIDADHPDEYWGICAEFCGTQHAKMFFLVIALPPAEFDAWLSEQQQAPPAPTAAVAQQGQQLFLDSACAKCHAIAGTSAKGRFGPDLTHLASRRTLASGILENNLDNLGAWLVDPQHFKSGNLMPASDLSNDELQAMLAYLQTLQ